MHKKKGKKKAGGLMSGRDGREGKEGEDDG